VGHDRFVSRIQEGAEVKAVALYFFMTVADLAILGGTVWLIGWQGWNPWWIVLAIILTAGTDPKRFLKSDSAYKSGDEK